MEILDLKQSISKNISKNGGREKTITAIIDVEGSEETLIIRDDHPSWDEISNAINNFSAGEMEEHELAELIYNRYNIINKVEEKFTKVQDILNGRMTISGNSVLVDYDTIDPALELHILRLLKEDGTPKDHDNWKAFSKFIEKLYSNMNEHVRKQLFGWLSYENTYGRGFTITSNGDFIGYKGCRMVNGVASSIHTGPAIVDGVKMNGHIPNKVGSIIEMPRTSVQDDPSVGCSTGLHVGTYDYAKSFSGECILTVSVNPADVVSVPTECDAQKIRTCRYKVLESTELPHTNTTYYDENDYDDYEDDYYDGVEDNMDHDNTNSNLRQVSDYTNTAPPANTYTPRGNAGEFDYATLAEDDEVELLYRRSDNRTNTYRILVKVVSRNHLEGTLTENDGYRRFLKSNIINIKKVNDAAKAAPNSNTNNHVNEDTSVVSKFHPGQVVRIAYKKLDGTINEYVLEIENVRNDVIVGVLLNGDGYRSFKSDRIVSITQED